MISRNLPSIITLLILITIAVFTNAAPIDTGSNTIQLNSILPVASASPTTEPTPNGAPCQHSSGLGIGCIYVENVCTCSSFVDSTLPMNGAPCKPPFGNGNGCIWVDNSCTCSNYGESPEPMNGAPCKPTSGDGIGCIWIDKNCTCSSDNPPIIPPPPFVVNITTFNVTDVIPPISVDDTQVNVTTRRRPPPSRRPPAPRPRSPPSRPRTNGKNGQNSKTDKMSPLIFDLNMDGVIHAASGAGFGIDINKDGISEASVTGGDGLLTIYSLDPTKAKIPIDLSGLFSTETYNPFTKLQMTTRNGFEALHQLARSAQQHAPERIIMDSQHIFMHELNAALKTVNYQIGFLSTLGANLVSQVQPLGNVNIVKLKYVDRESRSAEYLKEQRDHERVEFIEEGRWMSDKNEGQNYLIVDAWYSMLNEKDALVIEKFLGTTML